MSGGGPGGSPRRETRSRTQKTLQTTVYLEASDLPNGVLPTKKQVIECMLYLLRPSRAGKLQRSKTDAAQLLASALQDHWMYCNIYTIHKMHISKKIMDLYERFCLNIRRPTSKQSEPWKAQMVVYNTTMDTLFDIFCEDEKARKKKEDEFNVKMADMEWIFLNDMRNARIGFCEDQVDRKWQKTVERKLMAEVSLQKMRQKNQTSYKHSVPLVGQAYDEAMNSSEVQDTDENDNAEDINFDPDDENKNKKRRLMTCDSSADKTGMPVMYRHIRAGQRKVKPEFYRTVDKLMSVFHCSYSQAVAAVVETANTMFGRHWKYHEEDPDKVDMDTVPADAQIRQAGKAILALTLSEIVEHMMNGSDVVITYHDDGSKKQGCGSFNVQGCTIDRKYRAFPTMPIASETRENLASLKLTVLNILSVVSNGKYSPKDLHEKITFKVTDGVSHNFYVEEIVALELGTDHIPDHLLCHTHPVMMFSRELVNMFSSIEQAIGSDKIFSKMLVNATNTHDSITEQFMHCVVNLFSPELNHKAWNQSAQFSIHIAPAKNLAVGFRKERFNRFVYLCAVILYLDPFIWSFLSKFEHVTNNLACIVRAFEDVDFLQVHLAVGALVGIHLVEPFLSLTTSSTVDYHQLTVSMRQLYMDLTTTKPEKLLDLTKPAFDFITKERFDSCKYNKDLLAAVKRIVDQDSERIVKVLSLTLPKLASGFHRQRANVFGFGSFDPDSSMLVSKKDQVKLMKAPINNLAAERHVGSVNYELKIRGGRQLKAASDSVVKAKSVDLIELKPVDEFDKFRELTKKDGKLVEIWKRWKEEQDKLEKTGLTMKEVLNEQTDKRRNTDLDKLKAMGGPFTKAEEVDAFVNSDVDNKTKVDRLYTEVRYCKNTSLSLPKASPLFRLKENYKNLPVSVYQTNLKTYLSKISCCANVSWADFDSVIDGIISK